MVEDSSDYRQPLYRRQKLRFKCTECGACCTGNDDYHVFIDKLQAEKIRVFLALTPAWFSRRYLATVDDMLVLQSRDDGRCILLDKDGRCRVYPVRPVQCQTYPFWPELLKTAKAWRQEGNRCEGIDRGDAVPLHVIEAALKKGRES
jgi:hypothetical protein